MTTSTSLNLRAVLKAAIARSGMDAPAAVVSGLTPAAKALYVAAAAHALPRGVVLYVVPGDGDLEQTVADVCFFVSALEGLSPSAAERAVLPFPVARSRSVPRSRAARRRHVGAGPRPARRRDRHRAHRRRVRRGAVAARQRAERLLRASMTLKPGQDIAPTDLAALLVDAGFSREDPADEHGEFAIRGGILDVFPAGEAHPVRLEFIGDTIETLRTYDPSTQRSIAPIDQVAIVPLRDVLDGRTGTTGTKGPAPRNGRTAATIFDYLARAKETRIIVSERDEVEAHRRPAAGASCSRATRRRQDERVRAEARTLVRPSPPSELFANWATIESRLAHATELAQLGIESPKSPISPIPSCRCQPGVELRGRLADWAAEIRARRDEGGMTLFVAATAGRAERTIELLKEYDVFAIPVERAEDARYAAVLVAIGALSRGFRLPDAGLQIYAEADVFEEERRAPERRRQASKAFLSDLRDLKPLDLVVHVDHGIGAFVGLKQIGVGDAMQEFLELRYAGDDKLFVPVERLDLVQKYTGASRPPIDRLGGTSWERAKTKVKKAMRDMAEELLKLYAARKAVPGHAFSPDSHWQQEFEDAFEYDLTLDQATAVADIKRDMESPTPMDRLLCGDVGYGKTEVAMRGRVQGGDGRQAGGLPRADDGAGVSA